MGDQWSCVREVSFLTDKLETFRLDVRQGRHHRRYSKPRDRLSVKASSRSKMSSIHSACSTSPFNIFIFKPSSCEKLDTDPDTHTRMLHERRHDPGQGRETTGTGTETGSRDNAGELG